MEIRDPSPGLTGILGSREEDLGSPVSTQGLPQIKGPHCTTTQPLNRGRLGSGVEVPRPWEGFLRKRVLELVGEWMSQWGRSDPGRPWEGGPHFLRRVT